MMVLYSEKAACCGCDACMDVCPRAAISMRADEDGFLYPAVDGNRCVDCGLCRRACPIQNELDIAPSAFAYAATACSEEILRRSSSGGIAAVLSEGIVRKGGVVYGAIMDSGDEGFFPRHIRVDSPDALQALQGSKYAQSDVTGAYERARRDLRDGRTVLFTGTPCQCAAMRRVAGELCDRLYTLDFVCHGVPNRKLMQDFLRFVQQKSGGTIQSVNFRGKSRGQGVMCEFAVAMPDHSERTIVKNGRTTPYFAAFLKGLISRDSCYACPYARLERGSDFTVGDFWGFHEQYPNAEREYGLSNRSGVSCVLVTSEKGNQLFHEQMAALTAMPAEAKKAAMGNDQLRAPCQRKPLRETLLATYRAEGYAGFDRQYRRIFWLDRAAMALLACSPKGLRREAMKLRGRLRSRARGGA